MDLVGVRTPSNTLADHAGNSEVGSIGESALELSTDAVKKRALLKRENPETVAAYFPLDFPPWKVVIKLLSTLESRGVLPKS